MGLPSSVVDWLQDAVISESMREAVLAVAGRCTVCVVRCRDRSVVRELMGVDDLLVAGSHGFDIWSPAAGTLGHEASGFDAVQRVADRVRDEAGAIDGALKGTGIGVLVSDPDDPERADRRTAAEFVLTSGQGGRTSPPHPGSMSPMGST
jgi:trehalose 6-phosphate phosphatase